VSAGVDHGSHANTRPNVEFAYTRADGYDFSGKFMAHDLRILDFAPVAMNRVNVRVTDSAVMNLDGDVFRTESATLKL